MGQRVEQKFVGQSSGRMERMFQNGEMAQARQGGKAVSRACGEGVKRVWE